MIAHELLRDDGILILTPQKPLEAADFNEIAAEVDVYIEEHGGLRGLMLYAESFPGWENFAGMIAHLRFIKDHHRKIRRVAAVTDSRFMTIMPRIMDHFINAEVRHFPHDQRQAALDWLRSE